MKRIAYISVKLSLALIIGLFPVALHADVGEESGDLMDEIEFIRVNMPGSGAEGFVPPSYIELNRWEDISESFLDGHPDVVDSLIGLYFPSYEIVRFTDTGFGNHEYLILRESVPVTLGWGTFILRLQNERKIAIEVPHGRYETNTPSEGVDIFRRTGARLFIMNGTHRCSNSASTPCDGYTSVCGSSGSYRISDMAHVTEAAFQGMHEAYTIKYPEGYAFSIHGTSSSDCSDIFLSSGKGSDSQPIIYEMRDNMNSSGNIFVSVSGDGTSACTLTGGTNVQGRMTNSSDEPCFQAASSNNGYFIHAEQQRRVRDNYSIYSKFINAINDAIDVVTSTGEIGLPVDVDLDLSNPSPNPSGSEVRMSLSSFRTQNVTVEVFDVAGRKVKTLYNGSLQKNDVIDLTLRSNRLPSGVYFIRARGTGYSTVRKVILTR